jgi:hypothetical protein
MAIAYPGIMKGPFGGPAGDTNQSILSLFKMLDNYGKNKNEDERMAKIMQALMASKQPNYQATLDPSGDMVLNTSQPTISEQMGSIFGNKDIPLPVQQGAMNMLKDQAYVQNLEKPQQQKQDYTVIKWWDATGKGHSNRIPEDSYNQFVERVEQMGGTVEKPEKEKPKDTKYKTIWVYKPGEPDSWREIEYEQGKLNEATKKYAKEGYRFRKEPPTGAGSATNELNTMKVNAWQAYFNGKASPEQKRLIKVDSDPYVARAAQMVINDVSNIGLTAEQMAKKTMKLAQTMRDAQGKTGQPQSFEEFVKEYDY